MKSAAVCVVPLVLLALVACGSKKSEVARPTSDPVDPAQTEPAVAEPAPDPADAVIAEMQRFTDQMCACADPACVDRVEKAALEWATANMEEIQRVTENPTPEQEARADRLGDQLDQCRDRASPPSPAAP